MLVSSGVIITSISLENDSVCFESHSLRIQILQINFLHNERERRKDGRRGDRCCPTTIKSLKSYSNFQRIHMQSLLSLSLSRSCEDEGNYRYMSRETRESWLRHYLDNRQHHEDHCKKREVLRGNFFSQRRLDRFRLVCCFNRLWSFTVDFSLFSWR